MPEQIRLAPPDQAARQRIKEDLTTTLFVEAGAGSGKTTALVERVEALVITGTAELRNIAAITFTDKAAAELRDRVRQTLEVRAADPAAPAEVVLRCRTALDQLDGAAIGTLHSFAQRLLTEHPVEAGLPPRIEVLDEVSSGIAFEARWVGFRDQLLEDPALERSLLLLVGAGANHHALRALAAEFDRNWDLVEERVPVDAPEPPPVRELLDRAMEAVEAAVALRDMCTDPKDKLCVFLDQLDDQLEPFRTETDDLELLALLDHNTEPKPPSMSPGTRGRPDAWPTPTDEIRAQIRTAGVALAKVRNDVGEAAAKRLGSAIRRFTLQAAEERRAAGLLDFHDLLVLARALLRNDQHGPVVRQRLHERYRRLLLDEFQDTDPIQIELAVRIAAADPGDPDAGAIPWPEVSVAPGHLFVVGDPKQSIYRFRRADIGTFLEARARFGAAAGGPLELTANFRTVAPTIAWVNHVFGTLMAEVPDAGGAVASQPEYVPLDPCRSEPPTGPPVAIIGPEPHDSGVLADALRKAEAADVVAAIRQSMREGWSVGDGTDPDGAGRFRPPRLGDITVLVPARTSLPFLEDALDAAGVPFRTETSSLVYATRAVRDLLMVLRAIDDPTDELCVISALRTPLLACGDDDLFRHKQEQRGSWSYLNDQPPSVASDSPVFHGLGYLASLHHERQWRSPSELLERIARDRRVLELGFAEGRPRDVWRRIRFVIDQARAWTEATGGSVREYLGWIDRQASEGARVAEAVLPETDDDAVRILTIHASKGLEFPITIVSGMSTAPQARPAPAQVVFPPAGGVGYKLGAAVTTNEFESFKPLDEQMAADERIRLLYVACTRARDHLVVSVHRKARKKADKAFDQKRTNAELIVTGMGAELMDAIPVIAVLPGGGEPMAALDGMLPSPPPPFEEWQSSLIVALDRAALPRAVAATALTDEGVFDAEGEPNEPDDTGAGLLKRPRDLDLPPWLKGRYGTAVGRAVHGTLQTIDLATGAGADAAVAAQCQAEAIPDRVADVGRLVAHALASPTVRQAARSPHWREVYACTPLDDGRLLEGYIDLLFRSDAGLVVVDYKTSGTDDPSELARRVEGYRTQGEAYARAVGAATAEPVVRTVFVFLTPGGAVDIDLEPRPISASAGATQLTLGV